MKRTTLLDTVQNPSDQTAEEGSAGGFGAHVLTFAANAGLLNGRIRMHVLCLSDRFIEQNTPDAMYDEAGLSPRQIVETVWKLVDSPAQPVRVTMLALTA